MDETERDEKIRLEKQAQAERAKFAAGMMKMSGEEYEKAKGSAKVIADEIDLRAFSLSWSRITSSTMMFRLETLDAMIAMVQRIPLDLGMDITTRPAFIELSSRLYAIRNKLIREKEQKINTLAPHLSTPDSSTK